MNLKIFVDRHPGTCYDISCILFILTIFIVGFQPEKRYVPWSCSMINTLSHLLKMIMNDFKIYKTQIQFEEQKNGTLRFYFFRIRFIVWPYNQIIILNIDVSAGVLLLCFWKFKSSFDWNPFATIFVWILNVHVKVLWMGSVEFIWVVLCK